jgi:hypothetical protein
MIQAYSHSQSETPLWVESGIRRKNLFKISSHFVIGADTHEMSTESEQETMRVRTVDRDVTFGVGRHQAVENATSRENSVLKA